MRRQPMPGGPGGSGDEDSEEHASFAPTLTRLTTRAPVKPQTRSRPLLDHFLSLLATLAIPLQLSSLALATPTLLLTVLEALLETRLIEVEKGWRGSTDNQDKRYLLAVLLEAITQVWEVVTRRTSECQNGWVWRPDEIDVNKAVNGDEEEIARIVEAMFHTENAAFLSVHSSTDVEQSPRAIVSTLSPPSIDPNLANPPTSSPPPPQLPPNASRPLDDPPALSPYTVALLAKRDALRAKLAVLERREGDRQLLKDQG
ncbi:hypothetical protein NBRC10513_000798 [Rhodotorula toruloides]